MERTLGGKMERWGYKTGPPQELKKLVNRNELKHKNGNPLKIFYNIMDPENC